MKVFLIPGLSFDHQIFSKLDLAQWDVQYINWIKPSINESIQAYSKRLAQRIPAQEEKVVLIGHSLGGIISQEISCFRKIYKIILISSIQSRDELPIHFKIIKPLHLHKLFTKELTLKTVKYWGKNQDYVTEDEQRLFKDMVGQQSNQYLQWALKTLSSWTQPNIPAETILTQIVGESDKTFPIKKIKAPDYIIKNAGHFMVYKRPETLTQLINKTLSVVPE